MADDIWDRIHAEMRRSFWVGVVAGAMAGTGLTCLFFLFVGWFLP